MKTIYITLTFLTFVFNGYTVAAMEAIRLVSGHGLCDKGLVHVHGLRM